MAVSNWTDATSSSIDRDSKVAWVNPTNADANDAVYATCAVAGSTYSDWLKTVGFGFDFISNISAINGIEFRVKRYGESGDIQDSSVRILKAGTAVGTDKATTTNWKSSDQGTYTIYGGSTDLWGTTWTVSDIENANFGIQISAENENASAKTAYIDNVQIRIHYTIDWGSYNRRVQLTIPASKVPQGSFSEILLWVGRDWVPSEMLDNGSNSCQANGGDIRVTLDSEGSSLVPIYLHNISLNATAADRELNMYLLLPSISSSSDTTIYLWYNSDDTETQTTASGIGGQYEVFKNFYFFLEMGQQGMLDAAGEGWSGLGPWTRNMTRGTAFELTGNHTGLFYALTEWDDDGTPNNEMFNMASVRRPGAEMMRFKVATTGDACLIALPTGVTDNDAYQGADVTFLWVGRPQSNLTGLINTSILAPANTANDTIHFGMASASGTNYRLVHGGSGEATTVVNDLAGNLLQSEYRTIHMTRKRLGQIFENGTLLGTGFMETDSTALPAGSAVGAINMEFRRTSVAYYANSSNLEADIIATLKKAVDTPERALLEHNALYGDPDFVEVGTPGGTGTIVTVTVTVKNAVTNATIEGARVYLLDDVNALGTNTPWEISTSQTTGDYVNHGNEIYKCLSDHTSSSTDEPGVGASWETYWFLIDEVLNGVTNSSGVITNSTYTYTGSTPVAGWARKSTAPGLFKQGVISATITSSGLSLTMLLIPDE